MPFVGKSPVTTFEATTAVQRFNGDNSDTTFTLNRTVSSVQDVLVSVDGVVQDTSAYTIPDGTTLTFTAAPSSGTANIFVNFLAPQTGTVTPADENKGNFKAGGLFRTNAQNLTANTTILATENAQVTGTFTIDSGVTLTVNSGGKVGGIMSTIKVDTYLTRGGASEIAIDKLKGASSASSISVVAEGGTNTTNLQQGLAKYWTNLDGTGTITTRDSFNHASETDHDTGKYTLTLTNAMSNGNYAITMSTGGSSSGSGRIFDDNTVRTTSAFKVVGQSLDNAAVMDIDNWNFAIHGDLA